MPMGTLPTAPTVDDCYFCDDTAKAVPRPSAGTYQVVCGGCLARGPTANGSEAAIRHWNRCQELMALGDAD